LPYCVPESELTVFSNERVYGGDAAARRQPPSPIEPAMKFSFNSFFDGANGAVRARTIAIYAILLAGNALAWLCAWTLFFDKPTLFGAAVLAYVLGLRHAVDADHLAAIDNVVRKLVQEGRKPISTGFFFSLGHSTVVALAVLAIATTATALHDRFGAFMSVGGVIGRALSAALLLAIGFANLIVLSQIWKTFAQARGEPLAMHHAGIEGPGGGILARLCGPLFRTISHPWHMYPLGFLFGLGFDTASEVGLLGISASQSGDGQSPWSILVFPALFAAGMTFIDTTDGLLMVRAYGWALVNPMRKLWYNFTITSASIAVAIFIGSIQMVGLLVDNGGLEGTLWQTVADLGNDITSFGFAIIGIVVVTWSLSAAVYRWQRLGVATVNAG
jgi:nickel/cobalt transporter (NiCoT) family protein